MENEYSLLLKKKHKEIRKRNALLSATDFHALSDNTMSDEMKDYRQQLRDITEGLSTKAQVEAKEFPTKP